jgi:SCY1-like protein 1
MHSLGLIHGYLSMNTVFVTQQADWKLCVMDLVTPLLDFTKGVREGVLSSAALEELGPAVQTPPELLLWSQNAPNKLEASQSVAVHSIDAWLLGCWLQTLFNTTHTLTARQDLKQTQLLPRPLQEYYMKLVTSSPKSRLEVSRLVDECTYFSNPLVDTCLFLETIAIKESYEKDNFFRKLPSVVKELPSIYCKYKVLPQLVAAMDYGSANTKLLPVLLQLARDLSDQEFSATLAPSIIKWHAMTDLNIRVALLELIDQYIARLSDTTVAQELFPKVIASINHQQPQIREVVLKAVPKIAPRLKPTVVKESLLKPLARALHAETMPQLRAAIVSTVSAIASGLDDETRAAVVLPCATTALRDVAPGVRAVGLQVLTRAVEQNHVSAVDVALKAMPIVAPLALDPSPEVRGLAVTALKAFVNLLEKYHASAAARESAAAQAQSNPTSPVVEQAKPAESSPGMLGWALSSITKKIYGGNDTANNPVNNNNASSAPTVNISHTSSNATPVNTPPPVKATATTHKPHVEEVRPSMRATEPEGDGWGWNEDALTQQMSDVKLPPNTSNVNKSAANTEDGWSAWGDNKEEEEEDWDFKPVQRETKIDAKKNKQDSLNQKLFAAKRK